MDFHVLGPLEVMEGDRPVPLGSPKQRSLLALFLVHPNEVLPTDRIIDELWGESPPVGRGKTLKVHVANLRKTLEPARAAGDEPHVLLTQSPGYVLRVLAEELDAARFEELVREADPLVDADPERAAALLGEALALWHGRPFEDVAYESFAQPEIRRLEEMRLHAVERNIEAELRLGRHAAIVGDLEGLVAQYPLRERLWGHLMAALYRSGRQAEALRAYQGACAALADVGMVPSAKLRGLEDRILAQDPALLEVAAEPGWVRSYELGDPIGEGVTGTTYRALQTSVGREVAIKAIRSDLANRPQFVRRFETEAQIVARLEHPHIVPLFDFWREPGAAYLVMPYLRGGSMAQALSGEAWSTDRTMTLVGQLGDALAYAHRSGVVHCDLHPGNVLLDEEGNAYLADFGIAVTVGSGQSVDEVPSAYRSPEQLRGEPATPQSDVFGLGLLTYCALTGGSPSAETSQVSDVDLVPHVREVLVTATAEHPKDRYPTVADFLDALRRAVGLSASAAEPHGELMRNPYKGLRAFHESDAGDFFGRDGLVNELLDATAQHRLVTVVGPSGCGKSSVVRAGLIPALRAGRVPGSEHWLIADFTPGSDPFEELAAALLGVGVQPIAGLAAQLRAEPERAPDLTKQMLPEGEALLLLVDQFEELWTLTRDEADRVAFLDALMGLATDAPLSTHLVLTLRADYLGHPLAHQRFANLLRPSVVMVAPPSAEGLVSAIRLPAIGVGVDLEPGLENQIVRDVVEQPGGLPLLQYALTELFERCKESGLTTAAYRASGGVLGALGRRAEQLYGQFDTDGRRAVRQVFLRLVVVSDDGEATRRRVPLEELSGLEVDAATLRSVLDRFGSSRLLTFDRDSQTRTPTVEVAHEALLAQWHRFETWIDDRRDDLIIHRRLHDAMLEWHEEGEAAGYLLTGGRLEHVEGWSATSDFRLNASERSYLVASRHQADAQRARRRRRRRRVMAAFAAAAVVAIALAVVALISQRSAEGSAAEAQRQQELALAAAEEAAAGERRARAQTLAVHASENLVADPELSTLLAIAAVVETKGAGEPVIQEAEEALHEALNAFRPYIGLPDVGQVAFTPEGTLLLVTGTAVAVIDPDSGAIQREYGASEPDAEIFALAAGRDETFVYSEWGVTDEENPNELVVRSLVTDDVRYLGSNTAFSLALSPDGTKLGVGDSAGWVEVKDLTGANGGVLDEIVRKHPDRNIRTGLAFSPDGTRVAVANIDDSVARVLDVDTGEWVLTLEGHMANTIRVGYLPDGRIVTTSHDYTLRLWDGETAELLDTANPSGGALWSLAVSADGTRVAVGGNAGHLSLWRVTPEGLQQATFLGGHLGRVISLAFHPNGEALASSAEDDSTRIWDLSGAAGGQIAVLDATSGGAVDYVTDGGRLATSFDWDLDAAVWDTESWERLTQMEGAAISSVEYSDWTAIDGIRFSPSGDLVATASWSGGEGPGAVRLWNATTGDLLYTLIDPTEARGGLAFSGDGTLVAAATCDQPLSLIPARVWDTQTGELRFEADQGGCGHKVDLSEDGRLLAVQAEGAVGNVHLFDLDSGAQIMTMSHRPYFKGAAQFSADGTMLLTAGLDGTARLWDVGTGEETLAFLGHDGAVEDAVFSPDDTRVATGGEDGTIRIWETVTGEELLTLQTGAGIRSVAWSPDGAQLAFGQSGPTRAGIHVWAMNIDELIGIAQSRLQRDFAASECELYDIEPCPAA